MFCENCGSKVSSDDAFCTNCGSPIKKDENVTEENVTETTTETVAEPVVENNESDNVEVTVNTDQTETTKIESVTVDTPIKTEKVKKGAGAGAVVIIIAIIAVLALVAGGLWFFLFKDNKNAFDAIKSAVKNMEDLKNYTIVVSADVETEGEDAMSANATIEADVDIENKMSEINAKVGYSGMELEMPAYIDFSDEKNGMVYFKLPSMLTGTDEWSKITLGEVNFDELVESTISEDATDKEKIDELQNKLKEIDFVKKAKSDDKNSNYYEIIINSENLKKISEVYEDLEISEEEIEEMNLEEGFVVGIYVNKKENYISKVVIDLTDFINETIEDDVKLKKLEAVIEYKNINKLEKIKVSKEAKDAEEVELSELMGMGGNSQDDEDDIIIDDEDETYVDDYAITDYDFVVKYEMPKGFEPSSVNSKDFKIYRNDDLRVIISNYWDTKDEMFDDIESDKEYYLGETEYYKNVTLSDEKKLTVNGKDFLYKELSYETSYNTKNYVTAICYQLDEEHVYRVEIEKSDSPITEEELKLFLDITVTKK